MPPSSSVVFSAGLVASAAICLSRAWTSATSSRSPSSRSAGSTWCAKAYTRRAASGDSRAASAACASRSLDMSNSLRRGAAVVGRHASSSGGVVLDEVVGGLGEAAVPADGELPAWPGVGLGEVGDPRAHEEVCHLRLDEGVHDGSGLLEARDRVTGEVEPGAGPAERQRDALGRVHAGEYERRLARGEVAAGEGGG